MKDAIDPRTGNYAEPKMGSNRSFGLVFAAVFVFIALWPLLRSERAHLWSLVVAAVFLAAALAVPQALAPLNRLWFRFGMLLGKVVTPLVMAILFFVVVTPIAFLMRLFGKDPLRLKLKPDSESYFIERAPPGPAAGSLKDQF